MIRLLPKFSTMALMLAASLVLLAGCAADRLHREGMLLIAAGKYEEGVVKLDEAVKEDPSNLQYRSAALNKRGELANRLNTSANAARASGRFDEAEKNYQQALKIDPANVRARDGLTSIARERKHAALIEEARAALKRNDTDRAVGLLRQVASENPENSDMLSLKRSIDEQQSKHWLAAPTLKSLSNKPVTLEFRDANLKMVFEVLSRTSGINFILDKDVRSDLKATLFLKQASLEDAVDLLLATNQLEKKVLNQHSVLIFPSTAAKLKDYQDLVVKSFYLANADVKQTQTMIKTMLKTKDIFIDEKLNMLMMRDTPDAIRLAEKLIAMQDLSEPEVMLEVEVLEIKRSRLMELGIQYPTQLSLTPLPSGTALTLNDLKHGGAGIGTSTPTLTINAKKEDGDVNLLANPRIRVRNREKAKILIGDKVPVITTTSGSTGFVSESVQYVDVGLKLEVEPNVFLQDDVGIKVALEVSSLVREVRSSTGTLTYQIGTRNASSTLRLKDGETQILAGLISDEDRSTANKIPGLGDLPMLGRLFSSHRDDNQKTEIVLSITPKLIRNIKRPDALNAEVWSGTEATLRLKPLTIQSVNIPSTQTSALVPRPTTAPAAAAATPTTTLPATSTVAVAPAAPNTPSDRAAMPQTPVAQPATQPVVPTTPAVTAPSAVSLLLQGPAQTKVSEQFKVTLRLRSDGDLRSMPFQIGFDPKVLQVVDISEGNYFKQNNAKTNFVHNVDASGGRAFVGAARSATDGVKGDEGVAVVTFKAMAPSARTEVKVLAATPIGVGNTTPTPSLPAPHVIAVGN